MIDGVVLEPSAFSMTFGSLPSMIEIQLFVVPKSIPITFPIIFSNNLWNIYGKAEMVYNPVNKYFLIFSELLKYCLYI